jgi:hypothetical protein
MSRNPQNDINPELANGCGSLALARYMAFLHSPQVLEEKEFLAENFSILNFKS